jgi:phosphatidate cytidylyltransferase
MPQFDTAKLQKRILSAIVLATLTIWAIWSGGLPFLLFLSALGCIALYEWVNLSLKARHKLFFIVLGVLYVGFSFICLYKIRESYSVFMGVLFVLMVWSSDIGAYFTGKLIGGSKMSPQISPNKTWAGYAGALLSPAIVGILFTMLYTKYSLDMDVSKTLLFFGPGLTGIAIGVAGQSGDLLISWFKRHVGVKDSGYLIPGHGGLLDRIDAMMLCAPVFLVAMKKFGYAFVS